MREENNVKELDEIFKLRNKYTNNDEMFYASLAISNNSMQGIPNRINNQELFPTIGTPMHPKDYIRYKIALAGIKDITSIAACCGSVLGEFKNFRELELMLDVSELESKTSMILLQALRENYPKSAFAYEILGFSIGCSIAVPVFVGSFIK